MPHFQQSAMADNLRRLGVIRLIVLSAMVAALCLAYAYQLEIPYRTLAIALVILCALSLASWQRSLQARPVTEREFLCHILLDVGGLAFLLYYTGGATNPFISYFLVPLSIAAATLPWRYTWLVALLCTGIYSLLLIYHQPLAVLSPHQHNGNSPNLHLLGMWANFVLSALLITWFVVRMASALRDRDEQLALMREQDLRDEQIMAVATLAAGTAHELGTPLNTMQILLDELNANNDPGSSQHEDLSLLSEQLGHCRSTLKKLVDTADRNQDGARGQYNIAGFLTEVLEDWRVLRPESMIREQLTHDLEDASLTADPTLKQALINLLNNAANASDELIELNARIEAGRVVINILDRGPGLPLDIADQVGKPVMVGSEDGMGIGLLLTHATVSRFGGEVTLRERQGGGTHTEVRLPASSGVKHA